MNKEPMINKNDFNENSDNLNFSQKVVDSADIVSIIGEYITLEKKGNDYKGLCPFHNDSDPSLSVSPQKKVYKCFSCNNAGNVITFVQRYENISYKEALIKVANKSGIKINIKEDSNAVRLQKYFSIMDDAAKCFEFYLTNTKEGEAALEYLNKRNISLDIIKRFRIGLSSHKENIICKSLIDTKKYLPIDLKELSLIKSDNEDLFHGRIMFPITDLKGNIIAFSGRIYDKPSSSKYINSLDSVLFKKKEVLFNYAACLNDIKLNDEVYIFEGFMDVIAAYRAGIKNAIATMGTALTENQIEIISKVTKNITICYDGDNPGIEAMKRAISLFSKHNIPVNTIVLPLGLDPDDYINKYGSESLRDLFKNHKISSIDYLYDVSKRDLDLNDSNSIMSFQRNVYDIIASSKTEAIKTYLLNKLSNDLNIKQESLLSDFNNIQRNKPKEVIKGPIKKTKPSGIKVNYEEAEKGVVYLSYLDRETCIKVKNKLGADEFFSSVNRNILFALYDYYDLSLSMNKDEFIKLLDPLELETFNSIINSCMFVSPNCLDDFLTYMINANKYKSEEYLYKKIKNETDNEKCQHYLEEYVKNKKNLIKIKKKRSD